MTNGTMRQKATSAFVKLGDACAPGIFLVPALHRIRNVHKQGSFMVSEPSKAQGRQRRANGVD